MSPKKTRRSNSVIVFSDYPDFRPNKTPSEIFREGAFGGTYWRPIYSAVTNKNYKHVHTNFPKSWWKGIPATHLTSPDYDKSVNKYKVKVGTSLEFWESKHWITKWDPYGWVMWYCNFYNGRRCPDDDRQIKRWMGVAGKGGRFKLSLINLLRKNKLKWNDASAYPRLRQTLLHWAYELTADDFRERKK